MSLSHKARVKRAFFIMAGIVGTLPGAGMDDNVIKHGLLMEKLTF